jgi:hypothetical protein
MNESYDQELQEEINFLFGEIVYLQDEIKKAKEAGDTDEYTRLMRAFLPLQKQYLKMCAEQEQRENAAGGADPLEEFNR